MDCSNALRSRWLLAVIFLLLAIAAAIAIALNCVGVKPRFYIQQVHILEDSINSSNPNTTIFMDLKFKRVIVSAPLHYDDLNITLSYAFNRSFSVGYCVVPGFSQGLKKTAHREAVVEARGLLWEDALRKISGGSTVGLNVELTTNYRLGQCDDNGDCSYTEAKVVAAADLRLDGSGVEVSKKPIRLIELL